VESLTDEIEARARAYIERIDSMGGAVEAIENGWIKQEIEEAAYRIAQGVESGARIVVGVNKFAGEREEGVEVPALDSDLRKRQLDRLGQVRSERDQGSVDRALKELEEAARGNENLLYPMKEALAAYATLGEVSEVLRGVFGEYEPKNI
jgi:methylmalonyl-CoA mutase N-terminal domain/subunit